MSKKLYHLQSHTILTISDPKTGICKLGLSDFALKYFLRFNKIDYKDYPKSKYGINNSTFLNLFIKQTHKKYENDLLIKQKNKSQQQFLNSVVPGNSLSLSQKIQYDRFLIKRGEPFALARTYEYDIQLTAPVDMRVIDINHHMYFWDHFLTVPYFFEVQCLNMSQLNDMVNQQTYAKAPKFFQYC